MDNKHFILRRRYKAILKNGNEVVLDLKPENEYYFYEQEIKYLIRAIRKSSIDVNDIVEIKTFFILEKTEKEVEFMIGL